MHGQKNIKSEDVYKYNMTGSARITWYWGAFVRPLLQWKSYRYYIFRVCIVIHHAMRMRYIVICGLSGCTIFFHISHKRHDFQENKCYLTWKCVWFSTIFIWKKNCHSKRIQRDMIKNVRGRTISSRTHRGKKVLRNSLLNTTVVAFKVLPLGSYAPMPVPSPPFLTVLELVLWNGLQSCPCITPDVINVIKIPSFQYFLYLREQRKVTGG